MIRTSAHCASFIYQTSANTLKYLEKKYAERYNHIYAYKYSVKAVSCIKRRSAAALRAACSYSLHHQPERTVYNMKYILIEKKDRIATLTINRPDALNALNSELLAELSDAWTQLQSDDEVLVIIVTGAGRAFVAGADIGEMSEMNMVEGRAFGNIGQQLFRRIEKSEKPVIAAVNGFALGGGLELAMACDIRIASEYAVFGQPETGLGIIPGFSGTQRLTAIVGRSRAMEMILGAENINAETAASYGLVSRVVPADKLIEEASALAAKIASRAPLAVKWASSAIKRGAETDIDSGIAIEADLFGMCFATADQKEGMKAFLERRPAEFTGK